MPSDDPLDDLDFDIEADLARAEQVLRVRVERRTYNKPVTIVEGFDPDAVDLKEVASDLKRRLGAGGTVEADTIEVQGDHPERVTALLRDWGFRVE